MTIYTLDELRGMERIDSRDLIDAAAALDVELEEDAELAEDIAELAEDIAEWNDGATLIREDMFEDYARELAEDIGAIDPNASWPLSCIDWKQAASELAVDYIAVEFLGYDYLVRA